jgi:hypothetical protein
MLEVAYRSGKPALAGARMQFTAALKAEGLL